MRGRAWIRSKRATSAVRPRGPALSFRSTGFRSTRSGTRVPVEDSERPVPVALRRWGQYACRSLCLRSSSLCSPPFSLRPAHVPHSPRRSWPCGINSPSSVARRHVGPACVAPTDASGSGCPGRGPNGGTRCRSSHRTPSYARPPSDARLGHPDAMARVVPVRDWGFVELEAACLQTGRLSSW